MFYGSGARKNEIIRYYPLLSGASDPASEEALDGAIDIMRKYQKIEEILDQLIDSKIRTYDAVIEIEDIVYGQTEVGNGNDD